MCLLARGCFWGETASVLLPASFVGRITTIRTAPLAVDSDIRRKWPAPKGDIRERSQREHPLQVATLNISISFFQNSCFIHRIPPHAEGRTRRHDTLGWAAMDVRMPPTSGVPRTAKSCGPGTATLASSLR